MGCAQSRIEREEAVARCKERKQFMREAVAARNAFAESHAAYTLVLKNTGAALSDFGQGEISYDAPAQASSPLPSSSTSSSAAAAVAAAAIPVAVQATMDTLPPPPPPLPDVSPSPLHRSVSMPEIPSKYTSKLPTDSTTSILEEVDEDGDEAEVESRRGAANTVGSSSPVTPPPPIRSKPQPVTPPPPPPPQPQSIPWDYFFLADETMSGPSLSHPEEIQEEPLEEKLKKPPSPAVDRNMVGVDEPPMTHPEKAVLETPPPVPIPVKKPKQGEAAHHQHAASTGAMETKRAKIVPYAVPTVSLLQVLNKLDDHFIKASQSASEVSKMMEANRMHYHSNFAHNSGYIDSTRVMKVITWNKSLKGMPNGDDEKDDFDNDELETLATVLDKMLAWEKKLYDEVKACEIMKIEYHRKVALLNKQKKHVGNPEAIEKTKAAVSHLHTRYVVDMQSMDTTVSEIQHLRDNQLYPKLVLLVDGLDKMWEAMYRHHDSQLKIVAELRTLDVSNAPKETSKQQYERTAQLCQVLEDWHSQFQKLMSDQKEYIHSLNSWLKLNLIPIENILKEKVSSPLGMHKPPIQALLHAWHDYLEKLPTDLAKNAISSFAAVINTILLLQQDELKQKERCEDARKEYTRKARAYEDWCHKHPHMMPSSEENAESSDTVNQRDPVAEKKFVVEALKSKLDNEVEAHHRVCKQVREKSLGCIKTHLPEFFRAMSNFAFASSEMYMMLKSISQTQNSAAVH